MLRTVQMRHKALKEPIEVPEQSVRHWERAGWELVAAPEKPAAAPDPAPQSPPVSGGPTPTARRQPTTERSAD